MQVTEKRVQRQVTPAAVDVNVEFAHVYGDETFGPEQLAGVQEVKRLRDRLNTAGLTYSLSVLIDDYNPVSVSLDVAGFVGMLSRHGAAPDHVVFETSLVETATSLLDRIDGREGRGLRRYVKSRRRIPCALLVAAWHLVRLGALALPPVADEMPVAFTYVPLVGEESLTVLPARFASVERRALEIIESSPHQHICTRIRHQFFQTP